MRMLFAPLILCASVFICPFAIDKGWTSAPHEESDNKESNKEKVKYPMPFDGYFKDLVAHGWKPLGELETEEKTVVGKKSDAVQTKFAKATKMRLSWVVIAAPIDIPAAQPIKVEYNVAFPKATETTFTLDDLTELARPRDVSKSPLRLVKESEGSQGYSFTAKAKNGVVTRFLFLQEKFEVIQAGKTIEEGYLTSIAIIALEKKVDKEEPPTKPKE